MKVGRLNFGPAPPGAYRSPYRDGLPGHHGRETELAAAVAVLPSCAKGCRRAYAYIHECGDVGSTDHEGRVHCFYSFPQRRCDLTDAGHIVDSGRHRKTPRGAAAIVWVTKRNRETP